MIPLTLENLGFRPISIGQININLSNNDDPSEPEICKLQSMPSYLSDTIIIEPGGIKTPKIKFQIMHFKPELERELVRIQNITKSTQYLRTSSISLTLPNGIVIQSDLTIVEAEK